MNANYKMIFFQFFLAVEIFVLETSLKLLQKMLVVASRTVSLRAQLSFQDALYALQKTSLMAMRLAMIAEIVLKFVPVSQTASITPLRI